MSFALPELPAGAAALLSRGLDELGLPSRIEASLSGYLRLLMLWNGTYNLTAIRDPEAMISKHLMDCLAMAPWIDAPSLVDVGTGAGLPGIPLAIACPDLRVALVETAGKKARFLREAVRHLSLTARVTVHSARAESLVLEERYDILTARAFGTFEQIISVGGHLLSPTGRLLAMKGRKDEIDAESVPQGWVLEACHPLKVPGLEAERHLVAIARSV